MFVFLSAGRGEGVLRGLEWLLGCLFYQKDCIKAFDKHSTEGKLSNQIHWEIKGYIWQKIWPIGEAGTSHYWEKGIDFSLKCSTDLTMDDESSLRQQKTWTGFT